MKKALKRHGSPEKITTDGLRSYKAAMNELGNADKQEIGRWANNRVDNSHLSFRRRERVMLNGTITTVPSTKWISRVGRSTIPAAMRGGKKIAPKGMMLTP